MVQDITLFDSLASLATSHAILRYVSSQRSSLLTRTVEHGYDCIYQGTTPRAWERTTNASYVESLERKVQELEASARLGASPAPAAQAPYPPQYQQADRFVAPSLRGEEQRAISSPASAQYGPIAGGSPYGPPANMNSHHHGLSRIRSTEMDPTRMRTHRSSMDDESPSETPAESEIRDVNAHTKVG